MNVLLEATPDVQQGLMIAGGLITLAFVLPIIVMVIRAIYKTFFWFEKCPKCGETGWDLYSEQVPPLPYPWMEKYLYLNCAHCQERVIVKTWTKMGNGTIYVSKT